MNNQTDVLAAATRMGTVDLAVADLDAMVAYYRDGVGLDVLDASGGSATLGRPGHPLLRLEHEPALRHAPAGQAGLYHTAILFESEADLAAALYSVATRYPRSFTGSADHLVSNAFYFDDPEGNGVELYWDRPRGDWAWDGRSVRMASLPLDPNGFVRDHLVIDGGVAASPLLASGSTVGHVHLKVGDIPTAREFYTGVVGFEVTAAFGAQALFVSAGGYHHHVGMNTWESRGAGPRTPALGLGLVSIRVPSRDDLGALASRLRDHRVDAEDDGRALVFRDPWRNAIRVESD